MSVLSEILAQKRLEVDIARRRIPLRMLKERLLDDPPPRDFAGALSTAVRPALIAEVKKASPSGGILRSDFEPEAIARAYEVNGAAAVSVLTDEQFFQGALEHLQRVRATVSIPVLRKDFIIDEYQIYESRHAGADAILLIAAALTQPQLESLLSISRSLGMACCVEVHDEMELESALTTDARIIGINNRDLHVFRTKIETTLQLMDRIPADRIIVSESGIRTPQDVDRLRRAGVDAILVGEALVRQPDIGAKVRELLAQPSG